VVSRPDLSDLFSDLISLSQKLKRSKKKITMDLIFLPTASITFSLLALTFPFLFFFFLLNPQMSLRSQPPASTDSDYTQLLLGDTASSSASPSRKQTADHQSSTTAAQSTAGATHSLSTLRQRLEKVRG